MFFQKQYPTYNQAHGEKRHRKSELPEILKDRSDPQKYQI